MYSSALLEVTSSDLQGGIINSSQKLRLKIHNLARGSGASSLERMLGRLEDVKEVYVNPSTEQAYLTYDANTLEGVCDSPTQNRAIHL